MRIAFDLDDTLIGCLHDFPEEAPRRWARCLVRERLRKGTAELMRRLTREGHEIWIYTTSQRSPAAIRWLFFLHGVRIRGVVNAQRHDREVARSSQAYRSCAKYPPAFGIDLLVDDLDGMEIESRRFGYRVIVVRPDDADWTTTLLAAISPSRR